MLERIRFRSWWRPPRVAGEGHAERRVTFLELFYDLVYVVIISELGHSLAEEITFARFGGFAFLSVIVWWAWFNGTIYYDTHGNNDIRTRVFTFLQMFTVAAMAVFARGALGDRSSGFALSYAAFHLILTWLWWRTGVHDPNHRPLSRPYSLTFLLTSFLFIGSIFVPTPWRFFAWGVGVAVDLLLLLLVLMWVTPATREHVNRILAVSPSAVERFGLFVIIVLGEVIVGVVAGVADQRVLTWRIAGTASIGIALGFGLWWIYFDVVSRRAPVARPGTVLSWIYLHLPVAVAIAAVGAVLLNVVEYGGESLRDESRWILLGAIATTVTSIAAIMWTLDLPVSDRRVYRGGSLVMLGAAVLCVGLGFLPFDATATLLAVAGLLLVPAVYGVVIWIVVFGAREMEL